MKKPIIHENVEQGTEEWHQLKCGKASASNMDALMAGGKGTTRNNYIAKIACEQLTGRPIIEKKYGSMERGNELEDDARALYEFRTGNEVKQVAFIEHAEIENFGCSPDGLVGDDGLIEIKTRIPTVQLELIRKKEIPSECMKQINAQMEISQRKWCDYVSYCPEMPEKHQLIIIRVERNEIELARTVEAVNRFLDDVADLVAELQ